MDIVMLFGTEVIDKISIENNKLHLPDYIMFLQEELIQRNEELLECHADVPQFALENVPSWMNYTSPFALYSA